MARRCSNHHGTTQHPPESRRSAPSCSSTLNFLDLRSSSPQHFSRPPVRSAPVQIMLRLRPSELTLTPEDVDEAFRRIASRRSLKNSRHVSPQQGRPILRRGPQRAVQDTITTLGDIPILRPRPQQATHSSLEDSIEDHSEQTTPSPRARIDSVSLPVSPSHTTERSPVPIDSPAPSALRNLNLPFRLGRAHRSSPTQSPTAEHPTDGDVSSPAHSATQPAATPTNSVNPVETDQTISSTHSAPSPSQAELRGGGRTPPLKSNQGSSQIPPPWNQDQDTNTDHEQPTLYLESYLNKGRPGDDRPRFEIRQLGPQGSQTEPRRVSGRMRTHMRSLSSGSAPTFGLSTQTQGHPASALDARTSSDDAFDTLALYEPAAFHPGAYAHQQRLPPAGTSRQFSSEASVASGAYSFYELPPMSRQVSGSQAGGNGPANAQYDGSAASEQASRDAYHDMRPPDASISGSIAQVPRHTIIAGQYSVSPLPSLPYNRQTTPAVSPASSEWTAFASSRVQSQGSAIQSPYVNYGLQPVPPGYQAAAPNSGYTVPSQGPAFQTPAWNIRTSIPPGFQGNANGLPHMASPVTSSTGYIDAATAVMQGRPSPLDPYSEYYQHHLGQQSARPPVPTQSVAPYPIDQYSASHRHSAIEFAHSSARRSQQPFAQHQDGAHVGRNLHTARANQRSSENAPVRQPTRGSGPSRISQVQRHREAFEAMHNWNPSDNTQPGQGRFSLPQSTAPRNTSNQFRAPESNRPSTMTTRWRRTPQMPSSPALQANQSPSAPLDPSAPAHRPSASPDVAPSNSPRNAPHMRGGAAPDRTLTRARRRITPARSPTHLHPPRASLPINHAVSLRSPLLHGTIPVRPIRRVPPQQRDQENSGAGEEQLMRQEAAAMHARYGEDAQRDVMDETPPRIGRVERRMFS